MNRQTRMAGLVVLACFVATMTARAQAPTPAAPAAKRVWIDVRTPEEYAEGHLTTAVNIPHETIHQYIARFVPSKATPVVVYCASGYRSGLAQRVLTQLGYTSVTNAGGYEQLRAAGWR
ncbi:MAG: rhodanese-like domain-containing protein [Gemmataceae bacterium]